MQPRDLSAHVEYRAGRGIEEVARELGRDPDEFITLSSNENPLGPSPQAVEAITETADRANFYPKAAHVDLRERIAETWSVTPEQVWLANGGDGAIDYLSRAMLEPNDAVLVPDPGFAYYGMSARFHHGTVTTYPLDREADFHYAAETVLSAYSGERIIYLNSPHNPTGATIPLEAIRSIATETDEDTLVVVDEAYGEFSDAESARTLLDRSDIAVLRSFSKAYGLAGIRLGYALVPTDWAEAYTRVNTPFAVSELACRAGLAALADTDHLDKTIEITQWARAHLRDKLTVPTWPSGGNFVLAAVDDAEQVTEQLQTKGIIVRDCTSFGLPGCIRISTGTRQTTPVAIKAINDVVEN